MSSENYIEKRTSIPDNIHPMLAHLDIELTERCNNACLHCYINCPAEDEKGKQRELSTAQWQEILRQAAGLGALSVRFTGGEPLMREDFSSLYQFARELGLKVMLFTNARRINREIANLFARIPPLEKIEVSVYGMTPETYDAVTCAPGAYAEFRQGIQNLLDFHIPFIVKGVFLPQNIHEMDEFERWSATLPWMNEPPSYLLSLYQRGRKDSAARSRVINRVRFTPEERVAVLARREKSYRLEMQRYCSQFTGPPGDALFHCGAGKGGCVDSYGFFQPCMLLRDPKLVYNTHTGSLRDALVNFFPRLKEINAADPQYLKRCARCFLHGLCEQCPAVSWIEHGTLDTPVDYFCKIAHAQARYLGLLEEGEQAWEVQDWRPRLERMEKAGTGP